MANLKRFATPEGVRENVSQFGDASAGYRNTPVSRLNTGAWMAPIDVPEEYTSQRQRAMQQKGIGPDAQQARGFQTEAIQQLGRLARGEDSIAKRVAQLQQERMRKAVSSQLAAQPGYDPAAMRGAQISLAGGQANLGAQAAVAQARERQDALKNYLAGAGQLRTGDLSTEQLLRQEALKREGLGLDWQKLGLQQALAQQGFAQEGEKLRLGRELELLNQAIRLETGGVTQEEGTDWGGVASGIGTGVGAVAGILAAAISDETTKQNISPGDATVQDILKSAEQIGPTQLDTVKQAKHSPLLSPDELRIKSQEDLANALTAEEYKAGDQIAAQELARIREESKVPAPVPQAVDPENPPTTGLPPQITPRETEEYMEAVQDKSKEMDTRALVGGLRGIGSSAGQIAGAFLNDRMKIIRNSPYAERPYSRGQGLFSDEDTKKGVKSDDEKIKDFLAAMDAKQFEYKPEYGPAGERVGVLAQDMARSDLGKDMVRRDEETGKLMVDVSADRFNPLVLASLANIDDRLRKLEG